MGKKSNYEIDGNLYEFNNERLKKIIKTQNPNHGAYEKFYREINSKYKWILPETAKSWVTRNTNPELDDVKLIAEILEIPYMQLLDCTHYAADSVKSKLQKIRFVGILDPFSVKYKDFSNVFDMIIGAGYNYSTGEYITSNFAERILNIIGGDEIEKHEFPELMGYKFVYTEEELSNMPENEFLSAMQNGYIDAEGNSFYDKSDRIALDRAKFAERLLKNVSWIDEEDRDELKEAIADAKKWWNDCEVPFAKLKVNINGCGRHIATFTYGEGWVNPTHEDRWTLILDILRLLGTQVETTGLCWMDEMYINQVESEMFLTIEAFKFY